MDSKKHAAENQTNKAESPVTPMEVAMDRWLECDLVALAMLAHQGRPPGSAGVAVEV
jgi:hypothetical protein